MSRFTDRIDMRFAYTPAASTNVARTIARERKRLADEKAKQETEAEAISVEQAVKVHVLKGGAQK